MNNLKLPNGFQFTHGDSIHTSNDPKPHLTGTLNGSTTHIYYHGQTTLGMFDRSLPGHRLGEVNSLHNSFPNTFKKSGF